MVGVEIGKFGDEWHPNKHTRPHPTDAYGTIEFQGGPHPTKAQVSRKIEGIRWKSKSCDKKLKRCKDLSSTFNLSWKYSLLCTRSTFLFNFWLPSKGSTQSGGAQLSDLPSNCDWLRLVSVISWYARLIIIDCFCLPFCSLLFLPLAPQSSSIIYLLKVFKVIIFFPSFFSTFAWHMTHVPNYWYNYLQRNGI